LTRTLLTRSALTERDSEHLHIKTWTLLENMAPKPEDGVIDLTDSPPAANVVSGLPASDIPIDDSDDEDLRLAIAMSLQEHESHAANESQVPDMDLKKKEVHQSNPSASGVLGIDRKAMEAERLARLKRKRDDETEHLPNAIRGPRISPPPIRREVKQYTVSQAAVSSNNIPSSTSTTLYPKGKVFKTHAPGYSSEGTISFSELVAPAKSFIWDFDWLFPHFSTNSTKFLLVMHAKSQIQRDQLESDFNGIPNIRLCFPWMEGNVNCMHSKLMLLFYDDEARCRIVVPTANLVGFDWGVGRVMENMLWLIDLPTLPPNQPPAETEFESSLDTFIRAQGVPANVLSKLSKHDFKETQGVRFVHTIGGSHVGQSWRDTGLCGLGKAISSLELATKDPIDIDFVTSSVGSLNEEFMRSIYLACQGDDGTSEFGVRNSKKGTVKRKHENDKALDLENAGRDWRDHFRVYFPSRDTVDSSNGGPRSAGTICFSGKWWESTKFPRENMRDCVSVRGGLLMHNKVSPLNPLTTHDETIMQEACINATGRLFLPDSLKVARGGVLAGPILVAPICLRAPGTSCSFGGCEFLILIARTGVDWCRIKLQSSQS
jgi:Tyrosyl-DNA phosphodiesterase/Ubiquitin interaction motif